MSSIHRGDLQKLHPEAVARFLGPDGPLSEAMKDFESRSAQQEMSASVATCLNSGGTLCVEAPTGVGKSLAYLLPVALWARLNERRVVIATRTINLQRQLIDQDLPMLAALIKSDAPDADEVTYIELVGRRNYVCPQRLEEAFRQPNLKQQLSDAQQQDLWRVKAWAARYDEHGGRIQDLADSPDWRVWDEVNADPDNCAGPRCSHYNRCPFFRSRRAATQTQLIVVNHALLLADVAQRNGEPHAEGVLPAWDAVVVDEGHHLEAEATRAFTVEVSQRQLERHLDRLIHPRIAGAGDLGRLDLALGAVSGALEEKAHALSNRIVEELPNWMAAVRQTGERLWEALAMAYGDDREARQIWIDAGRMASPEWEATRARLDELRVTLERLVARLQTLLDDAAGHGIIEIEPFVEQAARAVASRAGRLRLMGEALASVSQVDLDRCTWVEVGLPPAPKRRRKIGIFAAPIAVGERLQQTFFGVNWASIMTSATLGADDRFALLKKRTGIDLCAPPAVTLALPSPFDHAGQAMLAVVPSLPDPRLDRGVPFIQALTTAVDQLSRAAGGGTLVLFTSFRAMRTVYDALASGFVVAGLEPMMQSRQGPSRAELLRRFRATERGVLFATDSFWEGVDVPGDALRQVIITKLPFAVPTEPIQMARHERLRAEGRNPFFELTLPQAVLRLRQGYGRLIRRCKDRGAVVILDPRIETARYGRQFLDALPPAPLYRGDLGTISARLRTFFGEDLGAHEAADQEA